MNASLLVAALAGISAGVIHALSGPDHLSAVAPLVINERSRRWRMGLFWGIGHSLGVWIIGLIALVLRGFLPIESLSSWSERLVGVVLIGVGLWGLRRAFVAKLPAPHVHDEEEPGKKRPGRAAVLIGGLHGLAGSSHIVGLLPALAFPSRAPRPPTSSASASGPILGMTAFSTTFGLFAHRITGRGVPPTRPSSPVSRRRRSWWAGTG